MKRSDRSMPTAILAGAAVLLAFLAGCSRPPAEFGEARSVPAENRPTAFGLGHVDRLGLRRTKESMGGGSGAAATPRWTADVPAHWQVAPPAQFRDLRWFIGGDPNAECYLLASVGGSMTANVSRWYLEQFGVEPPGPAAIAALPTHLLLGEPATLFEVHGTFRERPDTKMLLLALHDGGMLRATFRMTAPADVADAERENFLRAAATVRQLEGQAAADQAAAGSSASGQDQATGQPGGQPGGQPAGVGPAAHGAAPPSPFRSEIPADWTAVADTGMRMLKHRFGDPSGGAPAGEVYVSQLGGDVEQMVPIFYSDMNTEPPDAAAIAALEKVPMLGGEAVLIDLEGDFRGIGTPIDGARMLVAVAGIPTGVVFAKMIGPAAAVAAQREAFLQFCRELERTDG